MKHATRILLSFLLVTPALYAGSPGSFLGVLVPPPRGAQAGKGWVYVRGSNGMVRQVAIENAGISYDPKCPASVRNRKPEKSLMAGTEVRVTAELGADGEWRATKVEILGRHKLSVEDDFDDEDVGDGPPLHRTAASWTI